MGDKVVGVASFIEHPKPAPAKSGCNLDEPVANGFTSLGTPQFLSVIESAQKAGAVINM